MKKFFEKFSNLFAYHNINREINILIACIALIVGFFFIDVKFGPVEKLEGKIINLETGYKARNITTSTPKGGTHTTTYSIKYHVLVVDCGGRFYEAEVEPNTFYTKEKNDRYTVTIFRGCITGIIYDIR